MKKIVAIICLLVIIPQLKAQSPIEVNQMQLNAGFGFSNYGLPVYVGLDYCFREDVTIGGEISYRSYHEDYFGLRYSHKLLGFSVNSNYHFNTLLDIPSEYDVYAGISVGFYSLSSSNNYPGNRTSGLGLGLQIGGRYYFNDNLGVNLQIGGGNAVSGGKIGISVKF